MRVLPYGHDKALKNKIHLVMELVSTGRFAALVSGLASGLGHSTTRAALIHLHGGDQRQRAIAEIVSDMVRSALDSQPPAGSGIRPEITAREPDLSGQCADNPGGHPPLEYVQGNGAAQ